MKYIRNLTSFKIKDLALKEFCRYSLCPQDYRILTVSPSNTIPLKKICQNSTLKGSEIGSESYIKESNYRFLKTANIQESLLIDTDTIEYCIPSSKAKEPLDDSILIVKDGAGNGLGEACLYLKDPNYIDYISAGLINIKIQEEFKYYVLGVLKSPYFKSFMDLNTAQGSTMRHAKLVALNFNVPVPENKQLIVLFSNLVRNAIDKEIIIRKKCDLINNLIEEELYRGHSPETLYSYPKINEIKQHQRLDTGLYTHGYVIPNNLISSYKYGFFYINEKSIKSGSTPKTRILNKQIVDFAYQWVTPTDISTNGFYNPKQIISTPSKNNLNKDALLFINRTSKGGKGEYVGVSCLYDFEKYAKGHHNQGIYRVTNMKKTDMCFIIAIMNSRFMRKICGAISTGSKMNEMKAKDFSKLKIPKFPKLLQKEIGMEYYNKIDKPVYSLDSYLETEAKRNKKLGIFQLNEELKQLRERTNQLLLEIILENIDVDINEYLNSI